MQFFKTDENCEFLKEIKKKGVLILKENKCNVLIANESGSVNNKHKLLVLSLEDENITEEVSKLCEAFLGFPEYYPTVNSPLNVIHSLNASLRNAILIEKLTKI